MVVAQLAEHLLTIPEVRSLNPVNRKIYIEHLLIVTRIENAKITNKRLGMA